MKNFSFLSIPACAMSLAATAFLVAGCAIEQMPAAGEEAAVAVEAESPETGEAEDTNVGTTSEALASCPSSNRVYVQYCKAPYISPGRHAVCRLKAGCTERDYSQHRAAMMRECELDVRAVCGRVDGWGISLP